MPDIKPDTRRKKRNPFDRFPRANVLVDSRNQHPEVANAPQYYDENGEINQRYKSGRGMSAAVGGRMGASLRTGNPMFDGGAVLGGVIGGLFNKNLAGHDLYNQDMESVIRQNETTAAQQRLEAQAELMRRQNEQLKIQQAKEDRAKLASEAKTLKDKAAILQTNINSTSGDERRYYQAQHAQLFGLPDPENIDDDYMVGWKNSNLGGDINYQTDPNGRIREATMMGQDGKPYSISRLGIKDQWDIALKENKLNPANVVDQTSVTEAFGQADAVLGPMKGQFKTNKGQFNATQYNAQRLQIANKIIASKKSNPDLETVDMEINVDGVPAVVKVPLRKKPMEQPTPPADNGSQFMPTDVGEAPKVYDVASPESVIKVPVGPMSASGKPMMQPPANGDTIKVDGVPASKSTKIKVSPTATAIPDYDTTGFQKGKTVISHGGKRYVWMGGNSYKEIQ
jgi:hypothetical protein